VPGEGKAPVSSVSEFQARRVVTGTGPDGRSTIVADTVSGTRISTPAFTTVDIWQLSDVPVPVGQESTLGADVVIDPPHGGLVTRVIAYPPDAEWAGTGAQEAALAAVGGATVQGDADEPPGMHVTDTVDILTVIEGEIWAVLEGTETRLRVGDTIVQRGTRHAWSNRSGRRAVLVATMISATR
jgi:quercetin dioxygenase-like cupin family protein